MANFAVQQETEAFAAAVAALVVPRKARRWQGQVRRLWDDVQARGFAERTDATKKLYMAKFRAAVRSALARAEPDEERRAKVEKELMEIVRIDRAILAKLHEAYTAKVRAGNADLVLVPEWERIVAAFRDMLSSDDMTMRAIAVMALTGRRFAEVLQAGTLAPSIDRTETSVVRHRWLLDFTGQLKTRGGEATTAGKTFRIPTLAPAKEVLAAFEAVRASPEGRAWFTATERQLSTTLNPQFNAALRASPVARIWPKGARLSVKELRTLYAEVAYNSFGPRTDRAPYFARILGHSADDLTTALSYIRFSLSEAALREGQEEMNRLTLLRDERAEAARAAKATSGDGAREEEDAPATEELDDVIER